MPSIKADQPITIIGGGAAGLSTAVSLKQLGLDSTVLDRGKSIGETWNRRYRCLKLHTTRRHSGLAHRPISDSYSTYLSKDEFATYLNDYASYFELDTVLDENVESTKNLKNQGNGLNWEIETNRRTRRAAVVIVATGHYSVPFVPSFEGLDSFTGQFIHSSQYIDGKCFNGKRVLVLGLGNSGADIAADLADHGLTNIRISVRSSPPIVPREMFGLVPVQLFGIALMPLGIPRILDSVGKVMRRLSIGNLSKYGLDSAAWGPFTSRKPAVIDTGFVYHLKNGTIVTRPPVVRFESRRVFFQDGTADSIDSVIAATGFRTGLENLLNIKGLLDDTGQPLYRSGQPTCLPGLYFIGFDETIRGHLFEINRESRRLGHEVKRYLNARSKE